MSNGQVIGPSYLISTTTSLWIVFDVLFGVMITYLIGIDKNTMLFVAQNQLASIPCAIAADPLSLSIVHPQTYLSKIAETQSVRGAARALSGALGNWTRKQLGLKRPNVI